MASWILGLVALLGVILPVSCTTCGFPGAPAHSSVTFTPDTQVAVEGTIAEYSCDRGFELLGPARRVCGVNGTWNPQGIPFCVLNVAAGKAPMQSSVAEGGIPQKAVDGSTSTFFDLSTCSLTEVEKSPWWYVNLLEPYMVQLVRIDFGQSCCAKGKKATIVVRVGNNRPDLGVNPICNRFTGIIEEGRPLFLPCNPPMPGAFVSVHFEGPPGVSLSICEAFVYTDQALPIERCPTFRDQKPGSTATYNGKCYIFYNQQPQNFGSAMEFCEERRGSLVDESNPALQGFLSWELWRRHRGDPNGQYWLGARRDTLDPLNWKWINGKTVTVSFWNLPSGTDDCARFDGTKGWLWSDTNCQLKLNYICQHRPTTCGKPEQPPNSTLISNNFEVGSRIEYVCDEGHLLVGPSRRNCLATGFYSEFPPVCRYLECGMPADITNGRLEFVNGTRQFKSMIQYRCNPGYILVGRDQLLCDVDQRWNGPPPRCEPVYCEEPKPLRHGGFTLSTNSTRLGTVVTYYCTNPTHHLVGPAKITCLKNGSYNAKPPVCAQASQGVPNKEPKEEEDASRKPMTPTVVRKRPGFGDPNKRARPGMMAQPNEKNGDRRRPFGRVPFPKKSIDIYPEPPQPMRPDRKDPNQQRDRPRPPIDNEIPDSANVQNSPAGADVPNPVENNRSETRQAQLNLGGIIALGVFGGFVFLAAIITTIVILIRRTNNRQSFLPESQSPSQAEDSDSNTDSGHSNTQPRSSLGSEVDREHSEVVVHAAATGGYKSEKRHRHHHHHHHKHRREGGGAEERHNSRHSRY